jgi:predicted Mrr-cat superfamily restriction endonuclease
VESEKTQRDADEYVLQSLSLLQVETEKILAQVKNGMQALQNEQANRNTPPS